MIILAKKKKEKKKRIKDKSKVEERLKSIATLEVPEKNEWKVENENKIDRYLKFNRSPRPKLAKKVLNRMQSKR